MKCFKFLLVALFFLSTNVIFSEDLSVMAKKAKKLVDDGVKYYLDNGEAKAFAEFDKPDGKFVDGELYLFTYDFNGKCVSHGANKALIGKDLIGLKDSDGKLLVKDFIELVKKQKEGWVDFMWTHPQTKKNTPKKAYVRQIGTKDLVIGCGYYYEKK